MTRTQIVAAACKRLGDSSTDFTTIVNGLFDTVWQDMAAAECLGDLKATATFDLVEDQEDYALATILTTAPIRVLTVWIPSFGTSGSAPLFRQAESEDEYQGMRAAWTDLRGTPRLWRVSPTRSTLQLWPPVDADNAGADLGSITYFGPPTAVGASAQPDIPVEDTPTIIWGLIAHAATFRDESLSDVDQAMQMYERGKSQMWGRLHNSGPARARAREF